MLTIGILISAAVSILGAVLHLRVSGRGAVDVSVPPALTSLKGIVGGAARLQPLAVIQLGVLLLLLTPIARVIFSLVLFTVQRDRMYMLITAIVLTVLLLGLLGGAA
jgi:uncharacterized membrane protein